MRDGNGKAILVGTVTGGAAAERFSIRGDKVRIRRRGSAVILEPVNEDWTWLNALVRKLDKDFVEAAQEQP